MPVKNIKEIKTGLRSKYRRLREDLSEEEKRSLDSEIQSRLLSLREYSQAETVFTYISKELEVDTLAIVRAAWANQKRVAVPRCVPGTRDMEFYYIRSWQDLEPASFGVMEPIVERCERVDDESKGFCLVPGFSFDVQGFRLGYGGGYYDRFLSRFGGFTVGICYSFCVQWNLPHGYYDRSVDLLVTEKYVRRTSAKVR
ncbi:MAG: 5-formyltetrahydrofolate cyclo-ligase [Clostridium sp.]|uniref:5-formyltetrahydrofolate cyclo-ligase n=1 Tax=Clostridium sp. TaxID=1506 RepID=UPI0029153E1F|nr:5-formyltetrahydrofolate cyclo-ligase [Clostridium sp.]MDU7337569.1 5-formyltetrahydrofolate cyclo-ligase [Clostridium sp.]